MSVEDLILLNNIDIFKDNNVKIKIFLLDKILNNIELIKYKFCIDYFILNNICSKFCKLIKSCDDFPVNL